MSIAHITLLTKDIIPFKEFFIKTLHWQPIEKPGNIAVTAAWLQIAPGQELHILENKEFDSLKFEQEYGRHIAIRWPEHEFESLKQRLTQHGAEIITAKRPTSFARFFFRSPDNYIFEVVPL